MIWIGKGYIEKVYHNDKVTMIQLSPYKSGTKVITKER